MMKNVPFDINTLKKTKTFETIGFDDNAFKLINTVNYILEMVIMNTLKYNKYTTIEEILDNQSIVGIDNDGIAYICEGLCLNGGLLVKFINGHKVCYKLNSKMCM